MSGAADIGNAASISLLLGFADESTFFQLGIQQGRTPACMDAQRRVTWQICDRFESFHERLRWFKVAEIEFDHGWIHDSGWFGQREQHGKLFRGSNGMRQVRRHVEQLAAFHHSWFAAESNLTFA